MDKSVQYDSVKGDFLSREHLKLLKKLMFHFVSAIESAPEGTLKLHLRKPSAVYIKIRKKARLRLHF